MKKKLWKRIGTAILAGALLAASWTLPSAAAGVEPVSYGLSVLATQTDVAIMAPIGNEISFSEDAIARALNLSSVRYITVHSLPAAEQGTLQLGSTRIVSGQSISAGNLGYMTFSARDESQPVHASFTFSANGSGTPIVCNLYLLARGNCTPTVSVASSLSLNVSTYKGLDAHGTLTAYDPDGDALCYEIVSYPEHGSLHLNNRTLGTYVYKPEDGYVGSDRFVYVARDRYGSYSTAATVSLSVDLAGTSVIYEDMQGMREYNAALALTEAGIMSGTQTGGRYYFHPQESVTRAEFLVMAMNAVGITDVPESSAGTFADAAAIPDSMKGYVALAYELGYIHGEDREGVLCFAPNEPISRAHAAVMLERIVGLDALAVTPTFADAAEIPTWATEAIYSLSAAGILCAADGYVSPTSVLTRAQAAHLLANTMAYMAE